VITPDGVIADLVRAGGIQVEQISHPDSRVVAYLGWSRVQRRDIISPEALDANYIRRSDAEIFSKPKL
jgi:hypothetical protein